MAETHDDGVKRILAKAEQRKKSYKDIKDYCTLDDILILLDAGAVALHLNAPQAGGRNYVHQVRYEGYQFVSTSDTPVAAFESYKLRRN
jgi:hypothetical protein